MEREIIYNLINAGTELEDQMRIIEEFDGLPKETFDNETQEFIELIKDIHNSGKTANIKTIKTFTTFKDYNLDIDMYFWDVDEEEALNLELDEAADLFITAKTKDVNVDILKKALADYKITGNPELLKNLNFKSEEKKKYVLPVYEVTKAGLEKLLKIKEKKDTTSIKFSNNFFYLHMILKGLEPGELIIMAARPGVGKTAFMLALVNDISKQGKKCLVISLEMTREELAERMLIAKTGITRSIIYSQKSFTDEKFDEFKKAALKINNQKIRFVDEPPSDFLEIENIIKSEHRKGLDIVFIDYLGLISSYAKTDGNLDTKTIISKISREAKRLAMELKIPIILLQQVNRNAAAGRRGNTSFVELQLTDLRDSGTLEQDANKVFLLWNQKPEKQEDKDNIQNSVYKVILSIAKNRNGQSNQKVLFEFNHKLQRVKEKSWLTKPSSWSDKKDDKNEE